LETDWRGVEEVRKLKKLRKLKDNTISCLSYSLILRAKQKNSVKIIADKK